MTKGTNAVRPAFRPGPTEPLARAASLREAAVDAAGAAQPSHRRMEREGAEHKSGSRRSGTRWRGRHGSFERGPYYAALDLGTNNCRLLIAEPRGEHFRVVDSFSRIVRLGEGVGQNGCLSEEAQSRAVEALKVCRQKLETRPIARTRLIATEACRQATNGRDFLERVQSEVGLRLEMIDRRTEAHLAAAGCAPLLDPATEGAVLFDIGGGSSEIVWLDRRRGRRRGLVRAWASLPVGVVTLAERYGGVDVTPAVFQAMVDDVRKEFFRFRARSALQSALRERRFHLLGTSGTVTTLAGVYLDLPRYDRRSVDGLWMEAADIEAMMTRLRAMDYAARIANPCIGRERADLVLAGCAIFEAIRSEWSCERLRVADRGLREGILIQLMRADGHLKPRPDQPRHDQHRRGDMKGGEGRGGEARACEAKGKRRGRPDISGDDA
ncbi:Ppx/GppA family phosphatase [Afifella sp. JA880]|uniref:Ppx/GppA phosphatase family protein n=1 Tax=Afifella sp. JA880 TaxID=2975280 RepID=UPI0021BB8552|nr:Ppx/GppA phosphatase family protein [Afifella sp. JA880]MCT8266479.1 Ppx/GppA family phosphatase [Afifella sp. JA880]